MGVGVSQVLCPSIHSRHPADMFSVVRLQAISEAFDDDASGFITVNEVNTFTTARPLGWSYVYSRKLTFLL
jgi:hypothetical protein